MLNAISSISETVFSIDVLTIGFHRDSSLATTPYTSIASNITIAVTTGSNKRNTEAITWPGALISIYMVTILRWSSSMSAFYRAMPAR